jgi:hypothetical protein
MSNSSDRHHVPSAGTETSPKQDLNSSLELAFETATAEIKLARLLVDVARAALFAGDMPRANEARARGVAAYSRAIQLSSQIVHKNKGSLLADLGSLQVALDELTSV